MKAQYGIFSAMIIALAGISASCDNQKATPSVQYSRNDTETIDIPYQPHGDHELIQVSFNGVPFNMLFDTGAGTCTLTRDDIIAMSNEGALDNYDFLRIEQYSIGDGSIMEAAVYNIDKVEIQGDNGRKFTFSNIEVAVALNGDGSRLLGKNIINHMGSFSIDRSSKLMKFDNR